MNASYRITECTLNENDLQANVFDEQWKEATKFSEFSNAALLPRKIDNMEKWITNFKEKLITIYQNNVLGDLSSIQDKRCRDLNYYINYVLYYIPQVNENIGKTPEIMESFQDFMNGIFSFWGSLGSVAKFKCKREQRDYTDKMHLIKLLDDYCENRNAFRTRLKEYNKTTCCKYAKHVNEMKRSFHEYILNQHVSKEEDDFHIEDNCTLKEFGKTFPNVTCNNDDMSEVESDDLLIPYETGYLYGSQQHMPSAIHTEDSLSSSPTKIALTSASTLLGACLSGLYLYRNSFLGSMFRNFQNKYNISHEDTYEEVNGIFSENPSHYVNTLQENDRFNIAYDTMNN
ncbi:PIR protein [Plasmodium ovale]|uniref:PIR protein n=1 Tax=Plasmodium ovale TaxID=36330 RepID=A0A1C3KK00_PLAOA|nr:PIR protein [Plasmodium ovale]